MWELMIRTAPGIFAAESFPELFDEITRARKGYPLCEIYSCVNAANEVQLCICEFPGEDTLVRASTRVRQVQLVCSGGYRNVPGYLATAWETAHAPPR